MSRSRVGDMHTSLGLTGPTSSSGGGRSDEKGEHDRGEALRYREHLKDLR